MISADTLNAFLEDFRKDLAEDLAVRLAAELPAPTRLVSFEQAGEILGGITRRAVQDLVTAGKLVALKVGAADGRSMIEVAEIDRYIAAQRVASRSVT